MANMTPQDRDQLRRWLAGRATLAEVEGASSIGILGNVRFTEAARRAYVLLWTWSAARFAGPANWAQARYASRCGFPALYRRFDRALAIMKRLEEGK